MKRITKIGVAIVALLSVVIGFGAAFSVAIGSVSADGGAELVVDGVGYGPGESHGGSVHWTIATPDPHSASYGDLKWKGNGSEHLDECECGVKLVHWVATAGGALTISHVICKEKETPPSTTTTTIPETTTTTTVPETTTTTEPPTTTVPPTTTEPSTTTTEPVTIPSTTTPTTLPGSSTTISPSTTVPEQSTIPPTTVMTEIDTPVAPPSIAEIPTTTIPPVQFVGDLPATGDRGAIFFAILGAIILVAGVTLYRVGVPRQKS